MRICSIHGSLDGAFRVLGHEVLSLRPAPGICDLDKVLDRKDFVPDLLIQQETLGARTLLRGLESLSCPKLFWSVDTHLNSFWQQYYGRLFDLVLTTQHSWVRRLHALGLPGVAWLPWFGFDHPWTPWSRRKHDMAFVGRVTGHRPVRKAFADFLQQEFDATIAQELSFEAMIALYADTRLAPNESILGEVNFRTFEAASCGCVVVSQDLGEDLDPLFTRNKEILVYDHALDLKSLLSFGLSHSDAMRRMAVAARARIHREHMPRHRASHVLDLATGCPSSGQTGPRARAGLLLARFELWQAGRLDVQGEQLLIDLLAIPLGPELLAALLVLTCRLEAKEKVIALLTSVLEKGQYQEALAVNLAGSMTALHLEAFPLARQFWYRQVQGQTARRSPVATPLELYQVWSRELVRIGRIHRPGRIFDHKIHLPASALECLFEAHARWPSDLGVQEQMKNLLSGFRGTEQVRLALLSNLSLHRPDNWRDGLELAMVNLRMFRTRQGLEEAVSARDTARVKGREKHFNRLLKGMDRSGTLTSALDQLH